MRRKRGAPKRRGLPDGALGGAAAPVGKGGRAEARGLPGAQRRVSTSQAEAAPAVAEGQHE